MNAAKAMLLGAAVAILTGCAVVRTLQKGEAIARVNPASIVAAPAQWDGREVEMVGLLVWETDNLGLYQSYGAYCRRGGEATAIHADWSKWPGVTRADNRRRVIVRGTFRNALAAQQAGGPVAVAASTPGPGPLEPGAVVRWLSLPMKPCPAALP
jgi:hypothetical protein